MHARFEEDLPAVRKMMADLPGGEAAAFTVSRGGQNVDVSLTTEERADMKGKEQEFVEWGFTATELTPEIIRGAQLPSRQGIFVSGSQVGGIAANARLQGGDLILEVDGQPIEGLKQFKERYDAIVAERKPLVMLLVKRGALTRFVLIKQDGTPPPPEALAAPTTPATEGGKIDE